MKQTVSFFCSFSRILLLLLLSAVSVLLLKLLIKPGSSLLLPAEAVNPPQEQPRRERGLRSVAAEAEDKAAGAEVLVAEEFVDVPREKPRISFSMKSTLEKLLEQDEGKEAQGAAIKKELPPLAIGGLSGGISVGGNAGLSVIKASLKDPSFVQKVRDLEDKRQDFYISILRKRGQIVTGEDGATTVVSYPQVPVRFPNNLKRSLADWTDKEKIWLNVTHFPWPQDASCRKYSVTFGRGLGVVGLASYPSSGNTWVRYLLEGVTGLYTGSMYNDLALRKKGFYGEGMPTNEGLVLTLKTHGHTTEKGSHVPREEQFRYNHFKEVNQTAILLIRNPFAAILGHRNLDQGGHTGLAKPEEFQGEGWDEFVRIKALSWLNFYTDWLDSAPSQQILVLHYENIKTNLRHSLRRILWFLNLSEDEGRLLCAETNPTGLFKREHPKTTFGDPFTAKQKVVIKDSIRRLNEKLKEKRKETLPTHLYQYFDP